MPSSKSLYQSLQDILHCYDSSKDGYMYRSAFTSSNISSTTSRFFIARFSISLTPSCESREHELLISRQEEINQELLELNLVDSCTDKS